jgi:hypothetical protein
MVFGGVFTLLISLMGQKGSFKPVASVIGLGCLPLMLERFLGLIYIFSGGRPGEFSADPTLIFPRFLSKTPLGFCVRGLDVFLLWSAALVGIGFSVLYRCGKKKSIVMTICFWVFTLGVFWVWDSLSGTHH